jgi:hypothetical protein
MFRCRLLALLAGLLACAPRPAAAELPWMLVRVECTDKAQRTRLLETDLDIDHAHGLEADALVNSAELEWLRAQGYSVTVLNEYPSRGLLARDAATTPEFLPQYYTYAEAAAKLNDLADGYPALTDLESLGSTLEGRPIWALKISDNAAVDEDEPEVLVMGCHHSREAISVIIPLALADSLLMNYGTNAQFTDWVDEREIWIVPVVNPDGLVYCETSNYFWRKNRRGGYGVDPNRNYDYQWGHDNVGSSPNTGSETYRGASPASENEIQAIQDLVDSRHFTFSVSYHSYGNWLLWGPGYKPALAPDQDIFAAYGDLVAPQNGFEPGNPASSTIYITNGDADDWLYHAPTHSPILAFTPEVGTTGFNPSAPEIPALTIDGLDCVWPALEHADRPGRLAPPGPPALEALPIDGDGAYDVAWTAPTIADTEPVAYELVEKTGPGVVTDGLEGGAGNFVLGGFSTSTVREYAGAFSLHSGTGNRLDRLCWAKEPYVVEPGDAFTFRAWWDIEDDWDYAYAILSTDGGRSFVPLPGNNTTLSDPNGRNADHGITGSSANQWLSMTFDLSAWIGQPVWLGFRYNTDESVSNPGLYVDNIHPVQTFAAQSTLSSAIAGTSHAVAGRTDGTYWYAVRGVDAEADWGYWSANSPVTVELSTSVDAAGPARAFDLSRARPTPFGERTEIRFRLPSASVHSLVVYDVSGRRVRTLSRGVLPAGPHTATWDGRDEQGRTVPAGVYFYALRAPEGELRERTLRLR